MGLVVGLAGCSAQPTVRPGVSGPPVPAGTSFSIIGANAEGNALAARARDAVVASLARHGHTVAPDAPARLEIGFTDRPASTGIGVIGGEELSASKRRGFLRACKRHVYRLTLAYYGAGAPSPVTRAWAEDRPCRGRTDAPAETSLPHLADDAVTALLAGLKPE